MSGFPTNGKEIYQLRIVNLNAEGRAIVAAAYDGSILAYDVNGKILWQKQSSDAFPYDLAVSDIDNDGFDEILVAYSDGTLHALDQDGKQLWHYESGEPEKTPPLYQVAVVKDKNVTTIFTGGISQKLFAISAKGEFLRSISFPHPIRHIRSGRFIAKDSDALAVMTTSSGLNGNVSLFIIDPNGMEIKWKISDICKGDIRFRRCFSVIAIDLDSDGYDEIAFSHNWDNKGKISIYSRNGECLSEKMDDRISNIQYRMNLLCGAQLPGNKEPFILGFYGNEIIKYEKDGSIRDCISGKYSHSCGTFDSTSGICYLGSDISGGDGIYAVDMNDESWREKYRNIRPVGTLSELERNLEKFYGQLSEFTPPDYQPVPRRINFTVDERFSKSFGTYKNIQLLPCMRYNEKHEKRDEIWNQHLDNRYKYDMAADEIIDSERRLEKAGIRHTIRINHASATYVSPKTLERILEAAPNTFYAFEFAEMVQLTDDIRDVVTLIILPLAESCLRHGKHIILQNKSSFWTSNCYADFWKKVLMDKKYHSVFIPSIEETNAATQELSIAGRIGLWKAGIFDTLSSVRFNLDDPCYDRMWEWSTQQNYCNFLRQAAFNAALGIDHFDIAYSQGGNFLNTTSPNQRQYLDAEFVSRMLPVFMLLDSGVIHVPDKNDLLSVTDFALGLQSPLSAEYMTHAGKLNRFDFTESEHNPMVIDRCDCYWRGAPVLPHDFTYYAMNSRRRMLNFLPVTPYGMVPIMPAEADLEKAGISDLIRTDGKSFIDEKGVPRDPKSYKPLVIEHLKKAQKKLPILVEGDVAWTVVRLDPTHIRVTLVDPGYITPADRNATVYLQNISGISCRDILSKEKLPIEDGRIKVHVPMGTIRVIDVTH